MLLDRRTERGSLDRVVADVQAGESRALVIRGEAGVGKTALLDYLTARAGQCRVARASGVQAEQELAFAAMHQLCAPMLHRLDHLPGPQRDALSTAFGLSAGNPPDRFLLGLAVLGLFAEEARERPLICVVDDAQWLDRASAQVLAFVARRLHVESVAMVFAIRDPDDVPELADLAELLVTGLPEDDARALWTSAHRGPVDERVLERVVAETHGNPLAMLELPRAFTPMELASGFGVSEARLPRRIEESFRRQVAPLPDETRRLLLVAAAEPVGDPVLVWQAAERLGIRSHAAGAAEAAGLVEFGARVRFRHPLVRSAIYRAASPQERRSVHKALAQVTDAAADPDRRAWHNAQAAAEPDETVAAELEHCAGRAQARGGLAAASFLERTTELTPDPVPGVANVLWPPLGPGTSPAVWTPRSDCWWSPNCAHWTSCSVPGPTCCGLASRSRRTVVATLRLCCSRPPANWSSWTFAWPATPTWMRCGAPGMRLTSPVVRLCVTWPKPPGPRRRRPGSRVRLTSCWTALRCGTPTATRPVCRCSSGRTRLRQSQPAQRRGAAVAVVRQHHLPGPVRRGNLRHADEPVRPARSRYRSVRHAAHGLDDADRRAGLRW